MNKFPNPPPDRRTTKKHSYTKYTEDDVKSNNSGNNMRKSNLSKEEETTKGIKSPMSPYHNGSNDEEYEKYNTMNLLKMKHIEDMRNSILSYKLLNDKRMFLSSSINTVNVNKSNIILFGPSGSGKSSLIKTLYRSLYGTPILPPEALNKLIIKDTFQNEGTLCFTQLHLKEETNTSSGIVVCDTRGHIQMNESEKEQFKVIIEGKCKSDVSVSQKKERDPMLLWEFWKKDSELFPKEIFNATEPGIDSLPHMIVLVFDGSLDEVIDSEDEQFYKDLIELSYKKGKITL